MRFALVNNERTEAKSELKGICPLCSGDVIAKCGDQRIHHWAHVSNKACDSWWEPETEWHRTWKNNFPVQWQEVILPDETGEKHIADIRTGHGLVIEFQHSHLDTDERNSREKFHKNMIWVVDGTRLNRDYPRFIKEINNFRRTGLHPFFFVSFPDGCFPKDWIESSVCVIFDFLGSMSPTNPQDVVVRNYLWCLLPGRAEGFAVVVPISRAEFVNRTRNHPHLFPDPAHKLVEAFAENVRQQRRAAEQRQANMIFRQYEQRFRRGNRHFRF
jgi:ssDNA-binding Zn-finger/Zn-ribbon topoisomerase 1